MTKSSTFISLFSFLFFISFSTLNAQRNGVRIAYIDMDEILSNMSDYTRGKEVLDQKVVQWQNEIDEKKMALKSQEDQLQAEKVLLTPELIEDRQAEIALFRAEIVALQNSYFGVNGKYVIQQSNLLKPVQDQVMNIVREIALEKRYDFVFDRSSDLIMLYSTKNYDISGLVLKRINAQERIKARKKQIEQRKTAIQKKLNN